MKIMPIICTLILALPLYGASYRVTPAGAGDKDGSTWANALQGVSTGGSNSFEEIVEGTPTAGDIFYVAGGTYTLTSALTPAVSGSGTAPFKVIGVKSTTTNENPVYSDWAFGDDRPLFDCGAYTFGPSAVGYWRFYNLRFTGTATYVARLYDAGAYLNCKSTNTSSSSERYAFYGRYYSTFYGCEVISNGSSSGRGIGLERDGSKVLFCNIHNCNGIGVFFTGNTEFISNSVIHNCGNGIYCYGSNKCTYGIMNNTIYGCTTGIRGEPNGDNCFFFNNIVSGCTNGAVWNTDSKSNVWDYNCWNNTTNWTHSAWMNGPNDVVDDPLLKDPANDDFTLDTGSPCFDAGMQLGANVGL